MDSYWWFLGWGRGFETENTYVAILACHSLPVWGAAKLFRTACALLYIPLSYVQELQFLHILSLFFLVFTSIIWSTEYEVVSHDTGSHVTKCGASFHMGN